MSGTWVGIYRSVYLQGALHPVSHGEMTVFKYLGNMVTLEDAFFLQCPEADHVLDAFHRQERRAPQFLHTWDLGPILCQ